MPLPGNSTQLRSPGGSPLISCPTANAKPKAEERSESAERRQPASSKPLFQEEKRIPPSLPPSAFAQDEPRVRPAAAAPQNPAPSPSPENLADSSPNPGRGLRAAGASVSGNRPRPSFVPTDCRARLFRRTRRAFSAEICR